MVLHCLLYLDDKWVVMYEVWKNQLIALLTCLISNTSIRAVGKSYWRFFECVATPTFLCILSVLYHLPCVVENADLFCSSSSWIHAFPFLLFNDVNKVFDFHPSQLTNLKWPFRMFFLKCFSYTWAFATASLRHTWETNLLCHLKVHGS